MRFLTKINLKHHFQPKSSHLQRKQVEVNKEGRIEVKESPQDELDAAAASQALESPLNDNASESLPTANTTADIEQIHQDISVTTDITASPTDSFPANDGCLDESGVASGNSSALITSSAEVSTPKMLVSLKLV